MWIYKNKVIESLENLPNSTLLFGFVYKITNQITGKIYIGKKQIVSKVKRALPKKELSEDKRKKTYKHVSKETNWMSYYGSSATLLADIEKFGKEAFTREILELACTKKYLTWSEIEHQIKNDVLRVDSYNDNVMGRYYRKDMTSKC